MSTNNGLEVKERQITTQQEAIHHQFVDRTNQSSIHHPITTFTSALHKIRPKSVSDKFKNTRHHAQELDSQAYQDRARKVESEMKLFKALNEFKTGALPTNEQFLQILDRCKMDKLVSIDSLSVEGQHVVGSFNELADTIKEILDVTFFYI